MPAVSKEQQAVMGMALAARRGEMKVSELSDTALKIYKSDMSDKEIEDFASTPKDGLPKRKMKSLKESILSTTNAGLERLIWKWLENHLISNVTDIAKAIKIVDGVINIEPVKIGSSKLSGSDDWVSIYCDDTELPEYIKFGTCILYEFELNCIKMTSTKGWPEIVTGSVVCGGTRVPNSEIREYYRNNQIGNIKDKVDLC